MDAAVAAAAHGVLVQLAPAQQKMLDVMLLLRANTLAQGPLGRAASAGRARCSRCSTRDLLPVVPSRGSVGASGDLAPLAHLALPLIGRGQGADRRSRGAGGARACAPAGSRRFVLDAKEGLALINGTQAMTSLLALAVLEARRLVRTADLVGALSTDALRGTDTAFDARIHAAAAAPRPARRAPQPLARCSQGSAIRESHRTTTCACRTRTRSAACRRCTARRATLLADVERKLAIEMNAVDRQPAGLPATRGEVLSGGNFHGEPMAFAADFLAIAARRARRDQRSGGSEKLTNDAFSGLPPFLVADAGLELRLHDRAGDGGRARRARTRCSATRRASTRSRPRPTRKTTSRWGWARRSSSAWSSPTSRRILAIELLAAAQGVDLLRPLSSSAPLERLHAAVRARVPAGTTIARWRPISRRQRRF